jgi:hypothetical protein
LVVLAILGPLAALKVLNDNSRTTQPFVALVLCLAGLGSQVFLLRRVRGRIEMAVFLYVTLALGSFVLVYTLARLFR